MTDEVGWFDDDGTDIEVRVELYEVSEFRFGAEPDELRLILIH